MLISSLSVHVGSNHVNGGGQNYDVGRVIEHPDFVPQDLSTPDLALVRVRPFELTVRLIMARTLDKI